MVLLLAFLTVLFLPSASAHGDAETIDWSGTLDPGEDVEFERPLHWHRLVGTLEAGTSTPDLVLVVIGPEATTTIPVGSDGTVNTVVQCCLQTTWADHTIRITNNGTTAFDVDIRIALLHDDYAVITDGAEGGNGRAILFFSALTGFAAWRSRPLATSDTKRSGRWRMISTLTIALAWALLLITALVGMIAFGGGPLLGSLTAFAFIPLPGPIAGAHVIGKAVLIVLWIIALFTWSGARRWNARTHDRWLAVAIMAGGPLFTLFTAVEYQLVPVVVGYGLVPPAVFLAVLWAGHRYPRADAIDRPSA